jgi:hypothetical protein
VVRALVGNAAAFTFRDDEVAWSPTEPQPFILAPRGQPSLTEVSQSTIAGNPPRRARSAPHFYDYLGERALLVDVPLDDGPVRVVSTMCQPLPSPEQLGAAVAITGEYPGWGRRCVRAG